MQRRPRLALGAPTKAARRILAPFVKVIRKKVKETIVPESTLFNKHLDRKPSLLLRDLTSSLSDNVDLPSLLHESSEVLKVTTGAHGASLYIVDSATGEIYQSQRYFDIPEPRIRWKIEEGTIVAAHVAFKKESVMIEDILQDERFPMGIGQKDQLTKSVLCVPVITPDGGVHAVIELFRDTSQDHFEEKDMKIATLITDWMGVAIYQNLERVEVQKKQELNDYLLSLTKVFFEEDVPTMKMISEMVKFVKVALNSDRSTFYLLDRESEDLQADIYEQGPNDTEIHKTQRGKLVGNDREIVSSVAKTGILVNIKDFFADSKIGNEINQETGFIIRSLLCIAVKGKDDILGVIEVANKKNGCFTKSDEILFEVFATYFALVLQFSDLQATFSKQEKINRVIHSLLQRQVGPCTHDHNYFMKNLNIKLPNNFLEFKYYIPEDLVDDLPVMTYAMIKEFSDPHLELDNANLGNFILAIRKFGMDQPYHNFEHEFDFTHTIYCILKRNQDLFTNQEIQALLVAGIAHCVDKPSHSSEFQVMTNSDIYQLYPKSSLHHYHAEITAELLEQFPIYKNMPKVDYRKFVESVKNYILRCDTRVWFFDKTARQLGDILNANSFRREDPEHLDLLLNMILAVGDLSGYAKPFLVARKIAEKKYREYYKEAETIKAKRPDCILINAYDKNNYEFMPEVQMTMLNQFIIRIFSGLKYFLPNTEEMLQLAVALRKTWKEIIEFRGRKLWKHEESYIGKKSPI